MGMLVYLLRAGKQNLIIGRCLESNPIYKSQSLMQKIDTPSAVFCLWNITTMPAGPPFFSTSLNTSDAFDDAQCTPAHTYPGAPPSSYFLLLLQQSKHNALFFSLF